MLDGLACGLRLRRTTDPSSELQHVTALGPAADPSASVPNGDIAFSRRARPIRHRRQLEPASDGESRPALRLREWLRLTCSRHIGDVEEGRDISGTTFGASGRRTVYSGGTS